MKTRSWTRAAVIALAAAIVIVLSAPLAAERSNQAIVFTQEPIADGEAAGSRIALLHPDGTLEVLSTEFASASDPGVSFDGARILFAGKRTAEEPWNIWEIHADGSSPRQLTDDLGDCREPFYLASASVNPPSFEDRVPWIGFTSTAAGALDDQGLAPAPSLYVMSLEPVAGRGTVVWRTTYNLGGDRFPTAMLDGRVLFTSRQRDRSQLLTVTWAGDNLNPFYTANDGPLYKTEACEMPDRTVVFVESQTATPERGGRLVRVSLRRPLGSHEVLSRGDGRYRTPHAAADALLVSYASSEQSFGIYRFDFETGGPGPVVYDDPAWHDVDAMPRAPHPEPIARIPMLEFASVLDIEGIEGAGQLHCMSVYDSDQPEIRRLEPGQVKWARFVKGVPEPASGPGEPSGDPSGDWPPPGVTVRLLGDVPVEPDGSFFVNVAGNVPFYIELLDEQKVTLHTMRTWMWVRSRSQRGCIGCHEDKELAPQNRATQALLKMRPTSLTDGGEEPRPVDP